MKKGGKTVKVNQDRRPNFRGEDGKLFLVLCFACEPERGRENYAPAVASGTCAWCGYQEKNKLVASLKGTCYDTFHVYT